MKMVAAVMLVGNGLAYCLWGSHIVVGELQ